MKKWLTAAFSLVIVLSLLVGCGGAAEPAPTPTPPTTPTVAWGDPPKDVISITPKHVGSVTYTFAGAIGDAFFRTYGVKVRPIPVGTATGRFVAVQSGAADFNCTGADAFQAVHGLFDFASEEWGPQAIGMIWHGASLQGMAGPATAGVKTPYDMKGKRVVWVVGGPAANAVVTGYLAYGELTWADVEVVEFPGWSKGAYGPIEGKADVSSYSLLGPQMRELEASPKGLQIIQIPNETAEDKAGWARFNEFVPYGLHHETSDPSFPGASADNPVHGFFYGHANIVASLDSDPKLAYFFAKACNETFDQWKGVNPMMEYCSLEMSLNPFASIPYHPGAVRYFKDIGVWTDAHEKHQTESLAAQKAMRALWDKTIAEFQALPEMKKGEFTKMWLEARTKAGFYTVTFPGID